MRLGRDTKVDLLLSVPLFSGCSRDEAKELASVADELDLREGTDLTREGKPGREFFVLVEGTADVIRGGEKIDELGPGAWLGEIALLTHGPRTATVTATSPVRVLVITDRAFRQVVTKIPGIAIKVMEKLGDRLGTDQSEELGATS